MANGLVTSTYAVVSLRLQWVHRSFVCESLDALGSGWVPLEDESSREEEEE